ncbi:MAG: CDP-alcohol phosphatidyltransferase family protein [Myxococcales bacterium]|nr:CDP-alcohol phosphatidyltransferase family protein [Myxococcales bacterium]
MASDFHVESNSKLEPWILRTFCEPLLRLIPERVHPNLLSMVNTTTMWTMFILAAAAPHLSPAYGFWARVGAAIGMFATMLLDSLDGMQARRTGRTSKLGEVLDHWLDAAHVPMIAAAIVLTLEVHPVLIVGVAITNVMIYHAQILLYHHTRRFVQSPVSGVDGQFGWSFGLVVVGVIFYYLPRDLVWLDWLIGAVALTAIVVQSLQCWFYYQKLGLLLRYHVPFVAMNVGFAIPLLLGQIDVWAFLFCGIFLSLRITGSYVIHSVLREPFGGVDWGVVGFIFAMPLACAYVDPIAYHGFTIQQLLPYAACVYMLARSLFDFARHYPRLRPSEDGAFKSL